MKIYFDNSTLNSANKFRGIGYYAKNLWENLQKIQDLQLEILDYKKSQKIEKNAIYHFPAFNPFFFSFPIQLIKQSIITIHDLIPLQFPEKYPSGFRAKIKWLAQKKLLNYAKHIITDSKASKKVIMQLTGLPKNKISVIYLAANPSYQKINDQKILKTIKNKYNLPDKFLLYVGDLNWNKNILRLVSVIQRLNYVLVVVGKQAVNKSIIPHPWNRDLRKFQEIARQSPQSILRLGYVSDQDLNIIYNLATALVYPSIAEGFGLPILEAMQAGCPVVGSKLSSVGEIIADAGVKFDPLDEDDMMSAIKKVYTDKNLRQDLSRKGLLRAKEFNWQKTAQKTVEVYKKFI